MSRRVLQPWTVLRCEDGSAIVVPSGTAPLDALRELLRSEYGGDWSGPAAPDLTAAAAQVRVQTWRSCTKAWREDWMVDDGFGGDWWAPDGDGARQILVAYYDGDVYALGKAASERASA